MKPTPLKNSTTLALVSLTLLPTGASAFINYSPASGAVYPGFASPGLGATSNTIVSTYNVQQFAGLGTAYAGTHAADIAGNPGFWDDAAGSGFQAQIQWTVNLDVKTTATAGTTGALADDFSIFGRGIGQSFQPKYFIDEDTDETDGITEITGFSFMAEWLGSTATTDPGGWTGRLDDRNNGTIRPIFTGWEEIGGGGSVDATLTALTDTGNPLAIGVGDLAPAGAGPYQTQAASINPANTIIAPTTTGSTSTWDNFGSQSAAGIDQFWFHGGGDLGTDLVSKFTVSFAGDRTDPMVGIPSGSTFSFSLDGASFAPDVIDVIPEPSRTVLLGLGIAGLLLRRRR